VYYIQRSICGHSAYCLVQIAGYCTHIITVGIGFEVQPYVFSTKLKLFGFTRMLFLLSVLANTLEFARIVDCFQNWTVSIPLCVHNNVLVKPSLHNNIIIVANH